MIKLLIRLAVLAVALAISTARADTVAFATSAGLSFRGGPSFTFGYTFTLASTVTVTQLGFYDVFGDGLSAAVPVTIWNSAGTVLAKATIPAGTGTLLNGYLYVALATPVSLAASTYTIAGYTSNGNDIGQYNLTTITGATGITYGAPRFKQGNAYPTTGVAGDTNGYFGPNFQIIPEPSTWALLGLGAAGAGFVALRRGCVLD